MVELSVIRDLVAIFGVIAGFSYYVLTVRINQRNMKITLTNNLIQQMLTEDFLTKQMELTYMEWEDYDDFEKRYGSDEHPENFVKRTLVFATYDSLGMLLLKGLADKEILYSSQIVSGVIFTWHKFREVLEVNRRLYSGADAWAGFEYLASEMLKLKKNRDPGWKVEMGNPRYDEDKKQIK